MFDQQDGQAEVIADLAYQRHQADLLLGIHTGRGLIEQQQLRIGGERAYDL